MNVFKTLNGEKIIVEKVEEAPKRPYFLITIDANKEDMHFAWWDDRDGMLKDAVERRNRGEQIITSDEIGYRCRHVEISEYTVDDFIEEINSAYDDAKEKGFDSIVLTIETDTEQTYYINDTEDGFQCDEFDYYFEDLDSIAEALFNEKIIGKSVEIRVE